MTVRRKAIVAVATTLAGFTVMLYFTSSRILLQGNAEFEKKDAVKAVERFLAVFATDMEHLRIEARDYAFWDDTYAFVVDMNEAYPQSNLVPESFAELEVNVSLFLDGEGNCLFAKACDPTLEREVDVPASLRDPAVTRTFVGRQSGGKDGTAGLVVLPEGIVTVATSPILTSRQEGPPRGTFVWVRFLDARTLGRLAAKTKQTVRIRPLDAPDLPVGPETLLTCSAENGGIVSRPINAEIVAGHTILRDIDGRPACLASVEIPRDAHRQGQQAMHTLINYVVGIGLVLGLLTLGLLERLAFGRLVRLNAAVTSVAAAPLSSARVPVDGHDEVGSLACAINGMLEAVQQSHEARIDEEARFRAVVEQTSVGICLIDAQSGQVLEANPKLQSLLGYSGEEMRGRRIDDLFVTESETAGGTASSALLSAEHSAGEHRCRCKDGTFIVVELSTTVISHGERRAVCMVIRDVTERKRAQDELIRIHTAVDGATDAVIIADCDGHVTYVNMAFGDLLQHTCESMNWVGIAAIFADPESGSKLLRTVLDKASWSGEAEMVSQSGRHFPALVRATPILSGDQHVIGILLVVNDVSEQKELESQLLQAQKLTSIGQLAAGIAHEINTPTQYVGDNTRFVGKKIGVLVDVVRTYGKLLSAAKQGPLSPSLLAEVETVVESAHVEYLCEELPAAVKDSLEGIKRVAEIVRAMKESSHPGNQGWMATDINHTIENTLTVARNEWKYVADLETDFEADLPLVPCLPGEFNQVILNIVINAAHAIGDVVAGGAKGKGTILVSTRRDGDWVEIRIRDTGPGIPDAIRDRIFDPFFTTKEVGKGTGQGLTISHAVITQKHKGTLTFETKLGQGTTFIIRLPLTAAADPQEMECVHAG